MADAIDTMVHIMQNIQPKVTKFHYQTLTVLYAGAFFTAGDRKIRISEAESSN